MKSLKEFGLEFINEMAADRKVAQQEIGVVMSGTRSSIVTQGTQHFTYQDMDTLIKNIRKETARIVDSELTRITIKSLGRIKEVISSSITIYDTDDSSEKIKLDESTREEIKNLKSQIKDQNRQLQQLETEKTQIQTQLAASSDQIAEIETEVKRVQTQYNNQQKELELHQKQSDNLLNEVQLKQALIDNLREKEIIHEKDIQEALASVAETYQIQENYYQRMLEEGIQQRTKEIRQEIEIDLEELNNKVETLATRADETQKAHKITVDRLEEGLKITEEELKVSQENLAKALTEKLEKNVLLDYTQRLLSTHPLYASILILLNLGGVLDLPTLAMSVGAHPLKLMQMLQELVNKGLITVSSDDPPMIAAVMV
jgi:chromosome segregation ATPase